MCVKCDGLSGTVPFARPWEYLRVVDHVREFVDGGLLRLVRGNCGLDVLRPGAPWPADLIEHVFQCASCGRAFHLRCETYHGSGGEWRVAGVS